MQLPDLIILLVLQGLATSETYGQLLAVYLVQNDL